MDLPALIPDALKKYSESLTDEELLEKLKRSSDLLPFAEFACKDETWSEEHEHFLQELFGTITKELFTANLSVEDSQPFIVSLQEHFLFHQKQLLFPCYLYYIFYFKNGEDAFIANSLLCASSSRYLYQLIQTTWNLQRNSTEIDLSADLLILMVEFIHTGEIKELWRVSEKKLLELLDFAKNWEIDALEKLCALAGKKFIHSQNVIPNILYAQKYGLIYWKQVNIDFFNSLSKGILFHQGDPDSLIVEFQNFNNPALEIYELISNSATHLIFSGNLPDQNEFSEIVRRTPRLIGVDLSGTNYFFERILDLPDRLNELVLVNTNWVNSEALRILGKKFSQLAYLDLSSNTQLNYTAWKELQYFKNLKTLNLSRCTRLTDSDLKLILQVQRALVELNLSGCIEISDRSAREIPHLCPRLINLNLSFCRGITDQTLAEISRTSFALNTLYLSHCPQITIKGVRDLVNFLSNLKILDISGCDINILTLKEKIKSKIQIKIIS